MGKKVLRTLFMFTSLFILFQSCEKEKSSELSGMWTLQDTAGWFYSAYDFINTNTVIEYENVGSEILNSRKYSIPNHPGWYSYAPETYTYVYEDNKVIISNGVIFTVIDNKLYKDGSSQIYIRW